MKKILSIGLLLPSILLLPNKLFAQVGASPSGGVVIQSSSTGGGSGTGNFTSPVVITLNGLTTTNVSGLTLRNTTPATVGVQFQNAPQIQSRSTGWNLSSVSSNTIDFYIRNIPYHNNVPSAAPGGALTFVSSINGGTEKVNLTLITGADGSSNSIFANNHFYVGRGSDLGFVDSDGTARSVLRSPQDGNLNIIKSSSGTGAGFDTGTANIIAIRDIGATFDAAVRASFHDSSTTSTLTVSSNTIVPTSTIHHLGAGLVKTITVPTTCTPTCFIMIIPDAAYTYDGTGNVLVPAGAGLALINKVMIFTWDGTKWNPSY